MNPIRVAVVNDYELVVAGLHAMLGRYPDRVEVVDDVLLGNGHGPTEPADVTLFDTFGRTQTGLAALKDLLENKNAGAVVLYSADDDANRMARAFELGAAGYIHKSVPARQLIDGLFEIVSGRRVILGAVREHRADPAEEWPGLAWGLTRREADVLALLADGLRNNDIAEGLYVSVDTVKTHLRNIYRKLHVTTRSQAVIAALSEPTFARRSRRVHSSG
ncbi:MAG TPA: response regulator transcription factor [Acidimicrobiales bacterium]|jgi:DNA-binding NarL/FixJ family response regulator|nr:response regulator transcription factor [Acidimicrobiales bacterium]